MMTGRHTLYVAATLTAMLAATFVLLELALTVLEPHLYLGAYVHDPDLGFRMRPYSGSSNAFGFNDYDYPLEKPPDHFRILFVGDSFGWAGGRDGNYTALLETAFERHFGHDRVEVVNSGYPSTHTGEQLAMLEKYGLRYGPDLVVLGFFAGNDFVDADPHRKRIVVGGAFVDIDPRDEMTFLGYPIVWRSRLLSLLAQHRTVFAELHRARIEEEARRRQSERRGARPPVPAVDSQDVAFSEETFLDIEYGRLAFCDVDALEQGLLDPRIDHVLESVGRMDELVRGHGADFVVGIYPDEFQVRETLLGQVLASKGLGADRFEVCCMQRILTRHLVDRGIPYVDMTDAFRREARHRDLYLPRNTHWNAAGNALAAEIWLEKLLPIVEARTRHPAPETDHGSRS